MKRGHYERGHNETSRGHNETGVGTQCYRGHNERGHNVTRPGKTPGKCSASNNQFPGNVCFHNMHELFFLLQAVRSIQNMQRFHNRY